MKSIVLCCMHIPFHLLKLHVPVFVRRGALHM